MMKRILLFFVCLFIIFIPIVSFATVPDQKDQFLGERCNTPRKNSGIIAGFFRGWEQTAFQLHGSGYLPVERYRCFKTMDECKKWLFTMNYYYNAKTTEASMCTLF